jgi:WD40 repeat protein
MENRIKVRQLDLFFQISGTLTGHQSRVTCASFSPDGHFVVTASLDKTAQDMGNRDRTMRR